MSLRTRLLTAACAAIVTGSALAVPAMASGRTEVDCRRDPDALAPALAAASPGATLAIRGTCVGTFTVTADGLNLVGNGRRPTIRGLPGAPALAAHVPVVIRGLHIAGGQGVLSSWHLTLVDSVVRESEAWGVAAPGSTFTIRRSVVRHNAAGGVFGRGTIDRSTVRDNGGVGVDTGGFSSITRSVVARNAGGGVLTITSLGFGLNAEVRVGRSRILDNGGSGIRAYAPTVVTDTLIRGNRAQGEGTLALGGGIFAEYIAGSRSNGRVTLARSHVVRNRAADGGGIHVNDPAAIVIRRSKVRWNSPNDCAGC